MYALSIELPDPDDIIVAASHNHLADTRVEFSAIDEGWVRHHLYTFVSLYLPYSKNARNRLPFGTVSSLRTEEAMVLE